MSARAATEELRLTDMPPEVVQKIAFESGVLFAADVGAMKRANHSLRDLLGGGNEGGDPVALRKHGRLLGPQARRGQKRAMALMAEGDEAGALFRWRALGESATRPRNQPLRTACKYGCLRAVRYLLGRRGVDPGCRALRSWSIRPGRYLNAPAVYAALGGHTAVVRELFADGRLRFPGPREVIIFLATVAAPGEARPDLPWVLPFAESLLARVVAVARTAIAVRDGPEKVREEISAFLGRPEFPSWRQSGRDPYRWRTSYANLRHSLPKIWASRGLPGLAREELAGLCWLFAWIARSR